MSGQSLSIWSFKMGWALGFILLNLSLAQILNGPESYVQAPAHDHPYFGPFGQGGNSIILVKVKNVGKEKLEVQHGLDPTSQNSMQDKTFLALGVLLNKGQV